MRAANNHTWGPKLHADGSATFDIWAPALPSLAVEISEKIYPMSPIGGSWYSVTVKGVKSDSTYLYVLPDGSRVPDPAPRFQPHGVFGPSRLWDHKAFGWTQNHWTGRPWEEHVFYEIHIGAFTAEGTFVAALEHLPRLAEMGFTAVEIMPLAQFPGERGWGYDGVFPYAPHNAYGSPDDFKCFVDAAHRCGLAVYLDVVYNHFGPEGNVLPQLAPDFFQADNPTPWGDRIDFGQDAVRRFFLDNVIYWIEAFCLDGLRLDAVDQIEDARDLHILQEISDAVRERFSERHVHLIVENPANGTDLLATHHEGRRLYDADWNDEFHHAVHVAVTGEASGHYEPFADAPFANIKKALAEGYLHEGKRTLPIEPSPSASLPPTAFVHFLQNHDQVGNRACGDRLHTAIDKHRFRVLTEILVLSPQIPLFFMGDDHLSNRPFHFFSDYEGEIAEAIKANRPREAENFGGFPPGVRPEDIADPNDRATFTRSKIAWDQTHTPEVSDWKILLAVLLAVRKKHVLPCLTGAEGYAGTVIPSEDSLIFIDWRMPGRMLRLRANLSQEPRDLDARLGQLVYATGSHTHGNSLEAWSTRLYIQPPA
ncbi:malto-oligosyltrehalose trehalohydrolase [Shinella curvata]|uniref:Malto-oligosyltrehalose trehalohydrolase n=1 Tax=Shinella curvata TaxID=1817964 RepID=A0ABT8XLK6_9HYPH|nr:malto-oligosyltrehalose trehalohydrolase [Shinella curvata]MCJ8056914.1 malto-oligosyltrehalose trehalohydrolase [Shinella curvata]MDO6124249.1 malto-oligosyltrehalose trehalohydrolase [Shinella curvata]